VLAAAIVAAPLLAACQPLYGTASSGAAMKDLMAGVEINTIPGRVGQRIRNELIFATTRGGHMAQPKYKLVIAIRESVTPLQVELVGNSQSEAYNLDAQFSLIRLSDGKVVFKGKSVGRAAYDRTLVTRSDGTTARLLYADTRARIDAENRAASTVAESIRTRIASYLSAEA